MQFYNDTKFDAVSHPLVAHMYLKKHIAAAGDDVLVIETNFNEDDAVYDERLFDLLADLSDIGAEAKAKIGHFDRIDIRQAH